jgi:signal transduction histidine kinase
LTARTRNLVALCVPVLAWILQYLTWGVIAPHSYFWFYPAVAIAAVVATDLRTGLFAAALSLLGAWYSFTEPRWAWHLAHPEDVITGLLFALLGVTYMLLVDRGRRHARAAARADAHALRSRDRERIAREMHDAVIQRLFAAGMRMQRLECDALAQADRAVALGIPLEVFHDGAPRALVLRLGESIAEVDAVISAIRTTIFDLRGADAAPGALRLSG